MTKYDGYVICTSPRSGSTLLCNLLASTQVAGNPASYFHRPSVSAWLRHFDLVTEASTPERDVLDTVVKAAINKGSPNTGLFGLRLQQSSFEFFNQKLAVLYPGALTDAQRIQAAFGRTAFLHLTRLDKVSQAVSHVKAEQTGLWHKAADGTELERQSPPQKPCYDSDSISLRLEEAKDCDRQWDRWFTTQNIDSFRITYEDLSSDPIKVLRQVLDHLGLDSDAADGVEPGVAKLADRTSQDWVARFSGSVPVPP